MIHLRFKSRVADEDDYFEVNGLFSDYEFHLVDIDIDYLTGIHRLDEKNVDIIRKRKTFDKK